MAKKDNLTDYLIDLAEGIRAKKGTTEPINPQDFRKEIESISGGGSAEGGSSWRYWDISNFPAENKTFFITTLIKFGASLMRSASSNGVIIVPTGMILEWGGNNADLSAITQLAWDESLTYTMNEDRLVTLGETLAREGLTPEVLAGLGCFEIPKEEFYKLD